MILTAGCTNENSLALIDDENNCSYDVAQRDECNWWRSIKRLLKLTLTLSNVSFWRSQMYFGRMKGFSIGISWYFCLSSLFVVSASMLLHPNLTLLYVFCITSRYREPPAAYNQLKLDNFTFWLPFRYSNKMFVCEWRTDSGTPTEFIETFQPTEGSNIAQSPRKISSVCSEVGRSKFSWANLKFLSLCNKSWNSVLNVDVIWSIVLRTSSVTWKWRDRRSANLRNRRIRG